MEVRSATVGIERSFGQAIVNMREGSNCPREVTCPTHNRILIDL